MNMMILNNTYCYSCYSSYIYNDKCYFDRRISQLKDISNPVPELNKQMVENAQPLRPQVRCT